MGPTRKSRSVNKRFSYSDEISPTKDGDTTNKKNQRLLHLNSICILHLPESESQLRLQLSAICFLCHCFESDARKQVSLLRLFLAMNPAACLSFLSRALQLEFLEHKCCDNGNELRSGWWFTTMTVVTDTMVLFSQIGTQPGLHLQLGCAYCVCNVCPNNWYQSFRGPEDTHDSGSTESDFQNNDESEDVQEDTKKKLSDMLGSHWSKDELEHFYEAYRKHGRDWRKVAAVLRNRTAEMVEAVYSLNKAYLSLPEGTASVVGFIAMMTDYYSNMTTMRSPKAARCAVVAGRNPSPEAAVSMVDLAGTSVSEEGDSEHERNDGVETSRKPQKRLQRKVHETTSKGSVERFRSHPDAVPSDYGCLSLLKKKRSGGSRPRAVGKRTPRFPVSHAYENIKGEKYFLQTRKGLKLRADNDDDVAHSIALALTEASKRGGSPQVSQTPNRRSDSLMSSPCRSAERMYDESDVASGWFVDNDTYDDDIEGSMEADNTDFSRDKSKERTNAGYMLHDRKGSQVKKVRVDRKENKHLEYIREACSGTEGQNLGTLRRNFDVEVADAKPSRPSSQGSKRRSKEAHTGRAINYLDSFRADETSAFDALETLANLSLMILPEANEAAKEGKVEHVDDSHLLLPMPASRHKEKRKSLALSSNGYQSISRLESADNKPQTSAKDLVDDTNVASEAKESHQLITKVSRKRQKIVAPKISKAEAPIDSTPIESLEAEATHAAQMPLNKHISQSSSPQLVKHSQHVCSTNHSKRDVRNSALSDVHVSEMNPSNIRTKVRSKRKMNKPEALEAAKFSDVVGTDKSSVHLPSLSHRTDKLKGKLSNSLSNQLMRRWCAFEWFYSAIDDPWFAKREFVEYLYHVGLGHVPRLTRVEWGVIRSSLGKPRRFSRQFLKEEKDKLNQYRDSVRTHYTELRSGSRDGLPTDLARPLSVGQCVIAIYPRTREIHDGTVLTVDNNRCCVQFDRPELGVEKIMDTDCMPLNPFENMPASLMRRTPVDKFFESLKEAQMNGLGRDQRLEGYTKCSSHEKLENMDEVASVKSDLQSRYGPRDFASNHHAAYTMPGTLAQIQAKELDVEAIAELTRALDKKEAVVFELRRMNDDVLENQTDGDFSLQDSDAFKKQYAAVLVQLNEANAQARVSSALYRLRQRNTYQRNLHLASWPRAVGDLSDHGAISSSSDHTTNRTEESECHVNEIVEMSRTRARTMVDIAIQAMSSLKLNPTVEIDKAVDYVSDRIPSDESGIPPARPIASDPVPPSLSLHEQLVSTKCTERQFPPAEVASILDSAVSSLQPCSPQNLQVYAEIQKCMGIIKNQILALVPT
ncbi:DIRP-like protein [Cynara cardunculus var. scolymus]|uniref:DIRP-like protein n=1 Tax=Cynara cardunculus var. scolymus TaxID=59895 RepID=A0A103XFN0_CYNCS|nr:DIRP-like protein [Cynara cardunculus var. scolymus]